MRLSRSSLWGHYYERERESGGGGREREWGRGERVGEGREREIIYPSVYSFSCRALHDVERWCFCITLTFVPVFNEAFCCCIQLPNKHKNLWILICQGNTCFRISTVFVETSTPSEVVTQRSFLQAPSSIGLSLAISRCVSLSLWVSRLSCLSSDTQKGGSDVLIAHWPFFLSLIPFYWWGATNVHRIRWKTIEHIFRTC